MTKTNELAKNGPTKAGWRPGEWARDVGVSRAYTYNLLAEGHLRSVKLGTARIITTTPQEFLASLDSEAA